MMTVADMNTGFARERELWAERENMDLDVRLAERSGDTDEIKAAKEAKAHNNASWYAQHHANLTAVREFLDAHGVDIAGVKRSLA